MDYLERQRRWINKGAYDVLLPFLLYPKIPLTATGILTAYDRRFLATRRQEYRPRSRLLPNWSQPL